MGQLYSLFWDSQLQQIILSPFFRKKFTIYNEGYDSDRSEEPLKLRWEKGWGCFVLFSGFKG